MSKPLFYLIGSGIVLVASEIRKSVMLHLEEKRKRQLIAHLYETMQDYMETEEYKNLPPMARVKYHGKMLRQIKSV